MSSYHWLLLPALVVSNCVALYTAYSYKRAYNAAQVDYSAYVLAKQQRRARLLREKSDKAGRKQRTAEREQQRPSKGSSQRSSQPPQPQPPPPPPAEPAAVESVPAADLVDSEDEDEATVVTVPAADAAAAGEEASTSTVRPPPLHPFTPRSNPSRVVYNEDALFWLQSQAVLPGCVVTSLPDVSEVPLGVQAWKMWFVDAVCEVIRRLPPDGLAFFYQTDVRMKGEWVDKAHLLCLGGDKAGGRLIWHKVVVQSSLGTIKGTKAAYAHLLCFAPLPITASSSPPPFAENGRSLSPDLLLSRGFMQWKRAMGLLACDFCCAFIQQHTQHRTVVDPFCGQGSALAVANARGMNAVGVDTSRRRCCIARQLDVRGMDFGGKEGKVVGDDEERFGTKGTKEKRRLKRLRKEDKHRASNGGAQPPPLQDTAAEDVHAGLSLLDAS